jgi:hypothetical protein
MKKRAGVSRGRSWAGSRWDIAVAPRACGWCGSPVTVGAIVLLVGRTTRRGVACRACAARHGYEPPASMTEAPVGFDVKLRQLPEGDR